MKKIKYIKVHKQITITQEEYDKAIELIKDGFLFVARDMDNNINGHDQIFAYFNKPKRLSTIWIKPVILTVLEVVKEIDHNIFLFVKWEGEPWLLEDIIKLHIKG